MRRPIGRGLALAAGLAVSGSAFAVPTANEVRQADRQCEAGLKALQTGNYDKAREAFARAYSAIPDFPPAHLGMGHVALAQKDFKGALEEYTKARDTWGSLGGFLDDLQMQRWSRAQDEIRRLQDQLREMANQARGVREGGAGPSTNDRNLERSLEQRIELLHAMPMPTNETTTEAPADVYFHVGNALFRLERYEEAQKSWETCAEKNPQFPLVHNNLAVLYMKAGRFEDARRAVAEAERLGMKVNPALKEDIDRLAVQKH